MLYKMRLNIRWLSSHLSAHVELSVLEFLFTFLEHANDLHTVCIFPPSHVQVSFSQARLQEREHVWELRSSFPIRPERAVSSNPLICQATSHEYK